MKQIKLFSVVLLLATIFVGFNACSSDDDDKKEDKLFTKTEEYKEYFWNESYIPIEEYYDSDWKYVGFWDQGQGAWTNARPYHIPDTLYFVKSDNPYAKIDIIHNEDDIFQYKYVLAYEDFLRFGYSSGNPLEYFHFAKRDTIVYTNQNQTGFIKYIRIN